MKLLNHPLHLLAIVVGAAAVAIVVWQVAPSSGHFVAYIGGLLAFTTAVDLARRLGLEPKNDPAAPRDQSKS